MDSVVSVSWLTARLANSDVVLLDATLPPVGVVPRVDVHARYLAAHLPSAVFFDIEALSDHNSPWPHTLPTPESFGAAMSALGVDNTAQIVVYEQEGIFSAPRAWWMLRTLGAERVAVLDGGLQAWKAAGLPLASGAEQRPAATFRASLQPGAVRDYAAMQAATLAGEQIVDARSKGRFSGSAPEPRPGLSSGHMPGSINVPFTELGEEGRWKSRTDLQELFRARGIDLQRPVITSCGSGVTAAALLLALELGGAGQVSLYDGSWAEYAAQPDAVILKDKEPAAS